jgi:FlaG/FlaF family flagellin (archaellin)
MARASQQIGEAVRRAILQGMAAVFSVVALGFLTAASWIAVADALDHLVAALAVGGVYLVIAIVLFLMARPRTTIDPEPTAANEARPPAPPLFEAFMTGLRTGQSLRRR